MIKYEDVKEKLLADPEVLKAYESHKPEFDIAQALIQARLKAPMTQTEVARHMHTSQSQVARIESGHDSPTFSSLHK